MPAGADKLRDIGRPRGPFTPGSGTGSSGSGSGSGQAEVLALGEEWRRVVAEVFPAKTREAKAGAVEIDARYSEEGRLKHALSLMGKMLCGDGQFLLDAGC